jgi:hypothetical protein
LIRGYWDRLQLLEQPLDGASVHEVGAHQASEFERAVHCFLGSLREPQEKEGNERNRDLNANGVLGDTDKVLDAQGLLDPTEEQFDIPYRLPLII